MLSQNQLHKLFKFDGTEFIDSLTDSQIKR
jgi:hypothetical protein